MRMSKNNKPSYKQVLLATYLSILCVSRAMAAVGSPVLPVGIWQTRGYGYIFEVHQGGITMYDTLGQQCYWHQDMSPEAFAGAFGDWVSGGSTSGRGSPWHLTVSGMTVSPLATLPPACKQASHVRDHDPLLNFDVFWETFQTHYAFFKQRGVDWNAVRTEYRPKAAILPKDGDLFPILAEMVGLLKDTHVHLSDGKRNAHVRKFAEVIEQGPQGPIKLDDHYLQAQLISYLIGNSTPLTAPAKSAGNQVVWYGKLRSPDSSPEHPVEYGYLAVFAMDGFKKGEEDNVPLDTRVASAESALHEAISSFQGVRGIIVDLRYNGGGEESISLAIASHFTNSERFVWSKRPYERGVSHPAYPMKLKPSANDRLAVPVAMLTDDFTVSAAETAAMAFRAIPGTAQIGQPTRGVLSDKLEKILPNGWEFTVSNEIYADPDRRVFEVQGVPPDIVTQFPPIHAPDAERFGRDIKTAISVLDKREMFKQEML